MATSIMDHRFSVKGHSLFFIQSFSRNGYLQREHCSAAILSGTSRMCDVNLPPSCWKMAYRLSVNNGHCSTSSSLPCTFNYLPSLSKNLFTCSSQWLTSFLHPGFHQPMKNSWPPSLALETIFFPCCTPCFTQYHCAPFFTQSLACFYRVSTSLRRSLAK